MIIAYFELEDAHNIPNFSPSMKKAPLPFYILDPILGAQLGRMSLVCVI